MSPRNDTVPSSDGRELLITRIFNAPRDLVFQAWIDPKHLAHWSGPRGFTTPHSTMDPRPGGVYRACLRSPEGIDHWIRGVYREITPPERLVMTHAWENDDGQPGPETVVTVTFAEQEGKTTMTFHQAFFESAASRDGHMEGWSSSFDRLAEYLARVETGTVQKETQQ